MNRFDDLLKILGKVADPKVEEGDETMLANNPRNWATDKLNTILPQSMQIAPQTVAEDKQFMQSLPEQMAGATMGGIRVGKGVQVLPTTQQLMEEAVTNANPKPMQANQVMNRFRDLFGDEASKRMDAVKKGQKPLGEYDSWKQEMLDSIRRGEK